MKRIDWTNLVVFFGFLALLYIAMGRDNATGLTRLQWFLPSSLVLSALCALLFRPSDDYQLDILAVPPNLFLFASSIMLFIGAGLLQEMQTIFLLMSSLFCIIFLFLPLRKVKKNEWVVLKDGQVLKPGEWFYIWLAPVLRPQIQVIPETIKISNHLVQLRFRNDIYMIVRVSYELRVKMNGIESLPLIFNCARFRLECTEWIERLLKGLAVETSLGWILLYNNENPKKRETSIMSVPVSWDGKMDMCVHSRRPAQPKK